MSTMGQLWMMKYEAIPDQITGGKLDRNGAIQEMQELGFKEQEAMDELDTTFDWTTEPPTQL